MGYASSERVPRIDTKYLPMSDDDVVRYVLVYEVFLMIV